jgi:hypothetical protein
VKTIYTSRYGDRHTALYGVVEQSLFADLVAALEIARAYQARCELLERDCEHLDAVIAESARHVEKLTKQRDTYASLLGMP